MLHTRRLLIAYAFLHLVGYSVSSLQVMTSWPSKHDEQEIQQWLLQILTNKNLQQLRYMVFANSINAYEEYCYNQVRQQIEASDDWNKLHLLGELVELYEDSVKDYPAQNRQAILDKQTPVPIARNAGIAVNALCKQMHGFVTKSQKRSWCKNDVKLIEKWLLQILTNESLQVLRDVAFESSINAYEASCYQQARENINASSKSYKLDLLDKLKEFYENRLVFVKNYSEQNRQAILDDQTPEPIARNAAVAVYTLCNRMHGFELQ